MINSNLERGNKKMELKTKYEYTYFIYPYVIKESKYLKYLMKLLKDKNCELRIFKKDKDMDIYSFFSHRTREYMFGTFNYSKNKIKQLEELPLETKAAILARNGCTMFEYTIPRDIQGKVQEKNGIFFKIPKVEIICFNTGICFLCVKTNIEDSDKFSDLLNFNYKFRDINQEFSNMKNYDKIRIQTDCFSDVMYFKEFVEKITGPVTESMKLDIDTERALTYSYACIDENGWNNMNDFDKIKDQYFKFLNILPNDNSVNYSKEEMKIISRWKYAKLGVTKQSVTLFSSSCDINNYTIFPSDFEEQYFYTYILAIYTKLYLKKINLKFRQGININKTRKEFIRFTKKLWINEVTDDDTGSIFYQHLKDILELDNIYFDTKNKFDILYKEMNIEKNTNNNILVVMLLFASFIINIINIIYLLKK